MKILIDNNLPLIIKKAFVDSDVSYVRDVLSKDATDDEIYRYCIGMEYDILITKDKNFAWVIENSNSKLKCILINTGNISTFNLINHIRNNFDNVTEFVGNKNKVLIL